MVENGFYKIKQEFIDLIKALGGQYKDTKDRPIYCCFQDKNIEGIYWAIPMSDLTHRTPEQIIKIENWCALSSRDIRSSYYHIGHTNRPAIYRISNCFPVIEKYIEDQYTSQGSHLILASENEIRTIRKKLSRVLLSESKNPDKYEQHITTIMNHLIKEI